MLNLAGLSVPWAYSLSTNRTPHRFTVVNDLSPASLVSHQHSSDLHSQHYPYQL